VAHVARRSQNEGITPKPNCRVAAGRSDGKTAGSNADFVSKVPMVRVIEINPGSIENIEKVLKKSPVSSIDNLEKLLKKY
jgi:L-asparaginase/Glu-tRNA(Gln) amidotransferase subunit D